MADLFRMSGSYATTPATGAQASADPQVSASIDERLSLANKTQVNVVLDDDLPRAVDLGGLSSAHVLVMRANGGKVRARFTSADGSVQAVPVDPFFVVISRTVPITALDLTRQTGVPVTVKVFMGEKPV